MGLRIQLERALEGIPCLFKKAQFLVKIARRLVNPRIFRGEIDPLLYHLQGAVRVTRGAISAGDVEISVQVTGVAIQASFKIRDRRCRVAALELGVSVCDQLLERSSFSQPSVRGRLG